MQVGHHKFLLDGLTVSHRARSSVILKSCSLRLCNNSEHLSQQGSNNQQVCSSKFSRKLTRRRGRWTPRLSVSPARCTGSFGAAGSARFSGRSARCRWAVCPAGWAGLPASPGDSRNRQHLLRQRLTATRLLRCSTSSARTPHPLSRSCLRSGDPATFSSRARCRLRLRCGSGAWHHQSSHIVRGVFICQAYEFGPGSGTEHQQHINARARRQRGDWWERNRCQNQNAELLVTHWRHYSLEHQPVEVPPRAKLSTNVATMCAPRWLRGGYNVCPVTRKRFWQSAGCVRSALPPVASGCASTRVYICNTQDCITVPRHLYELQPAAAPRVAGATQMITRRPRCRFYFPENPKWRCVLKGKEVKWEGKVYIFKWNWIQMIFPRVHLKK